MGRLVLASASPARLLTLRQAHLDPLQVVSHVDEDAILAAHAHADIPTQVTALAQAKASAVATHIATGQVSGLDRAGDVIVVGCDSMFEMDGRLYGKPRDAAQARERLRSMSARTGVLHTGHALVRLPPGQWACAAAATEVDIAELSPAEIEAYLATGEPLQVAGSFTIDGYGGPFIRGIRGDHHNVVGISLPVLRTLVSQVGVSITDLWARA